MRETLAGRVRFGKFELDLRAGELREGGRKVVLQDQPFQVLQILVDYEGQIATREEIQKKLWPNDTIVEFDHGINTAIKKLRVALGDSAENPRYIETVARRGYRLMVPVQRMQSSGGDRPPSGEPSGSDDGTAARRQLEPTSLTGKTVSHYRVLEVVGGGGMGVVYRAEDVKLGRAVALKFLPEDVSNDPRALERFEREARAASALEHSNICSIYEFGEHEGQPFIVMQLLQGQTLRDRLADLRARADQDKALPLDQVLDFAIQITHGLEAAHEKGIIHRDIKPANIFITEKGVVKILDFGLAKLVDPIDKEGHSSRVETTGDAQTPAPDNASEALNLSRPGVVLGTAAYMSPEQVRGENLDARTDLFSFGVVLYEMATGQRGFVGIANAMPVPVSEVTSVVPPELEPIIRKALERDRDQRYQSAAEMRADLETVKRGRESTAGAAPESSKSGRRKSWQLTAAAVVLAALLAGGLFWRSRKVSTLTEKDTVVVADFDNTTGDVVFDGTLRQGLSSQLDQSPFLNLLSDVRIAQTLSLMSKPKDERLTRDLAREVCQRTASAATIEGAIATLGSQYVVGLRAMNCHTGDLLAEEQATANSKEEVLKALGGAATKLRRKLGESLASVQKYDAPPESVTTPSLEALEAYSLGRKMFFAKGETAALPSYKRAVELDPNFARAYASMSVAYGNLGEGGRAAEYARKAYELREKVSERERFAIEANYYTYTTGELEKAAQVYELWQQTYPRDFQPYTGLGLISAGLGDWEKFLEEDREAMRLEPNNEINYSNLGSAYQNLNRLDEAEAVYKRADELKLGGEDLLFNRYQSAFLKSDPARMAEMVAAAMGKPGTEDVLLAAQADTEAWYGRLKNARELTRRAMDSAQHNDAKETAAVYQASAALREVESGNWERARADADAAVKLAPNRDVQAIAALALARAGDTRGAEKLAAELDQSFPLDTLVQRYWLPTVRAAIALQRQDPNQAIELLKVSSAIELGQVSQATGFLCPIYLRAQAFLMLHDGSAARAEFQKFIDHRGVVANAQWGALARLGLARAYALDATKDLAARDRVRAAYQDFLALWKGADPDLPIFKTAQAEYEALK